MGARLGLLRPACVTSRLSTPGCDRWRLFAVRLGRGAAATVDRRGGCAPRCTPAGSPSGLEARPRRIHNSRCEKAQTKKAEISGRTPNALPALSGLLRARVPTGWSALSSLLVFGQHPVDRGTADVKCARDRCNGLTACTHPARCRLGLVEDLGSADCLPTCATPYAPLSDVPDPTPTQAQPSSPAHQPPFAPLRSRCRCPHAATAEQSHARLARGWLS